LIRRCFEPDSIAFMNPTAVLGVVVVFVFVTFDDFDSIGVDGSEEYNGGGGEEEEESEDPDVDDVNGMMPNLQVLICLHRLTRVRRTCLRRPKLSTYTSQCAAIYLF